MQHSLSQHSEEIDNKETEALFTAPPPPDVLFSHRIVQHRIPSSMLDPDAVKVVRRLSRFGYEAYLVGGCVRDILFSHQPKDFDVVTSALPSEVRRLFRNCRLIGRRFRLAHLLFKHGKVIEVATFRRSPTKEDDISDPHAAENLFGGPADDAIRRDFTTNALMYDVLKKEIHDYVGGISDIESHMLRTIGDPNRRFVEDPVRIIRAVKFSLRLNLQFDPEFFEAMKQHACLISECAPARLMEEIFKLLRSGVSAQCFNLLYYIGILSKMMPELNRMLTDFEDPNTSWHILENMDTRLMEGHHVSESTMLAALIYPFCRHMLDEGGDLSQRFSEKLASLFHPMKLTKRHSAHLRQIFLAQRRLIKGPNTKRARRILERDYAAHALDLMELVAESDQEKEILNEWLKIFATRKNGTSRRRRTGKKGASQEANSLSRRPGRRRRRAIPKKDTPPIS